MIGSLAMATPFNNPKAIAEAGETIYREKFQQELEKTQSGKFAAINVHAKTVTVADTPSEALLKAKHADPSGVFHLIRIGFPGAFQLSRYQRVSPQDSLIK
jgi:hypothetical protein